MGRGARVPLRRSGPGAELGVAEGSGRWGASGQACSSRPGRIGRARAPQHSARSPGHWGGWGSSQAVAGQAITSQRPSHCPSRGTGQPGERPTVETATRVRHSPAIARQVHGHEAGPRSSWEVKSAGQGRGPAPDQRARGPARAGLPGSGRRSSGKGGSGASA